MPRRSAFPVGAPGIAVLWAGACVAHLARDEAVIRGEHQILAPAVLRSPFWSQPGALADLLVELA